MTRSPIELLWTAKNTLFKFVKKKWFEVVNGQHQPSTWYCVWIPNENLIFFLRIDHSNSAGLFSVFYYLIASIWVDGQKLPLVNLSEALSSSVGRLSSTKLASASNLNEVRGEGEGVTKYLLDLKSGSPSRKLCHHFMFHPLFANFGATWTDRKFGHQ